MVAFQDAVQRVREYLIDVRSGERTCQAAVSIDDVIGEVGQLGGGRGQAGGRIADDGRTVALVVPAAAAENVVLVHRAAGLFVCAERRAVRIELVSFQQYPDRW